MDALGVIEREAEFVQIQLRRKITDTCLIDHNSQREKVVELGSVPFC